MARRSNEQDHGSDRSRIRVFYAEAEGSNQSLQDLMRTLTAAMARPVPAALAPKRVNLADAQAPSDGAPAEPTLFDNETINHIEPNLSDLATEPSPVPNGPTRRSRGEGPKTDYNAGLALVPDLDFMPKGEKSLNDFLAEKKPGTAEKQVVVFVYYLTHTLSVSPITADHVLTCFKASGKRVPADLRQTIRNIIKNKAWLNGDLDNLRVTTQGENHVEHVLGRSSGDGGAEGK